MRWARSAKSVGVVCAALMATPSLVPAARGDPSTQPATQPAAAAGADATSPKAVVRAFVTAQIKGDGPAIRAALVSTNPTEERMAGAIADLAVAIAELDRAMVAKFGQGATEQLMGDPNDALRANLDRLDKATEEVTGDTATVTSPADAGGPTPPGGAAPAATGPSPQDSMTLRRVNGQWKVSVSDLAKGSNDDNVQKTLASVDAAVAGYRTVLADLTAGRLATVDAVGSELNAKLMPAGGGGGGGGGGAPGAVAPPR